MYDRRFNAASGYSFSTRHPLGQCGPSVFTRPKLPLAVAHQNERPTHYLAIGFLDNLFAYDRIARETIPAVQVSYGYIELFVAIENSLLRVIYYIHLNLII